MLRRFAWPGALLALLMTSLSTAPALATDCSPPSGVSTCIDPDTLWFTAGPSRFAAIAPAAGVGKKKLALATALSFISRPLQLNVPSPDPNGRDIRVVGDALDLTLASAYGVDDRLEVTVAAPFTLHQSGAGAEGITSQSASPLNRTAVHDPRVGVGLALPVPDSLVRNAGLHAKARFELGLPLGDAELYAGESAFVAAPSLALAFQKGRFYGGAELGARLRRSVPFATARMGSELVTSVGLGFDILDRDLLSFGVEAWMLPVLVSQPGRNSQNDSVHDGILVPAEWLASLRSAPFGRELAFQLGAGTGIPLSSEVHSDSAGATTDHFAGITTPRWRGILALRYTPE